MSLSPQIKPVEWDKVALGIDCYEITEPTPAVFEQALRRPGHYTVKIDPLASKRDLHRYGFYYCDTLLEPWLVAQDLTPCRDVDCRISRDMPIEALVAINHGAYRHGRFHRDFNVATGHADLRYDNWLRQLHRAGNIFSVLVRDELAGFLARSGDVIVLHAINPAFRGMGLSRFLWTAVCRSMFDEGSAEIRSSVSAANVPMLTQCAALGFRIRNPTDIYHRLVP